MSDEKAITLHGFNEDRARLVKETVAKGTTDLEFELFLYQCNRTQLDPLAKQIYPVKRWNNKLRREEMAIQTSIDGFRLIAQRSGEYGGQDGPYWCGEDGQWVDVWLHKTPPLAAKVGVLRAGFAAPLYSVALWSEYAPYDAKGELAFMWKKMPALMLAKVAESLALRRSFPQELSGIYTDEEMDQARQTTAPPKMVAIESPKKQEVQDENVEIDFVTGEIISTPIEVESEPPEVDGEDVILDEPESDVGKIRLQILEANKPLMFSQLAATAMVVCPYYKNEQHIYNTLKQYPFPSGYAVTPRKAIKEPSNQVKILDFLVKHAIDKGWVEPIDSQSDNDEQDLAG